MNCVGNFDVSAELVSCIERYNELVCANVMGWETYTFIISSKPKYGPGSSVGIATELRAGRSGIESRWGRDFPSFQTGPGAHPASCIIGTGCRGY